MEKDYTEFSYIFPPRPEVKSPRENIKFIESRGFWAQPKYNGSCCILATDGDKVRIMNRHEEEFSRMLIEDDDLRNMHIGPTGTWCYLVGEYMNKSKKSDFGKTFNGCIVFFDVLVYGGYSLVGETFEERYYQLETGFGRDIAQCTDSRWVYETGRPKAYLAPVFKRDLGAYWDEAVLTDMVEGFVFKSPDSKLEPGRREKNNTSWQVKVRKPTKNYQF